MKLKRIFLIPLLLLTINAFARIPAVIDVKVDNNNYGNDYFKIIKTNESIKFRFRDGRSHYIDQMLISTNGGVEEDSFAKVYVDGEVVATLEQDKTYPVFIRGNVSELVIELKRRSQIKILDMKIYTARKSYFSYTGLERSVRERYDVLKWSKSILDLVCEFQILSQGLKFGEDVYTKYLLNLKRAAFEVLMSDNSRDARSLITKKKAENLIDAIDAVAPLFESDYMLMDSRFDRLGLDLQIIKKDMIEKYDLNREY